MAKANRELLEVTVKQDKINFEQEIYLQALRFNQQNSQLLVAQRADTIAHRRLEITKQRYFLGKIQLLTSTLHSTKRYSPGKIL